MVLVIGSGIFIYRLSTKDELTIIKNGNITIEINQSFKTDVHDGNPYIIIPVNKNLSNFNAKVYYNEDHDLEDNTVNRFFKDLDTKKPGESVHSFVFGDEEMILHIIVE